MSWAFFDAMFRLGTWRRRLAVVGALLWCAKFCSSLCCAASEPDVVLRGSITEADHQTYREVPFTVPEGVARITVTFAYSGREHRSTIDLGLIGPNGFAGADGFRGWSGGNKSVFTVSAVDATPSFLAGPVRPGRWALLLGIPNIRRGVTSQFTANIYFSRTLSAADEPPFLREPLEQTSRWYRGDFHAHSGHSDGWVSLQSAKRIPAPVAVALHEAAAAGLDFVSLTEHNTPSVAWSLRELQPMYPRLLLLPGQELTTFSGHANVFGTIARFDFRVGSTTVPDWNALLAQIKSEKALISINHPVRPSGEECMGCGWSNEANMDAIDAIEVINGRDAGTKFSGITFWHEQLNRGRRLVGIGGSDTHGWREVPGQGATTLGIGRPATLVYASELSVKGVLEGIKQGRVVIDNSGQTDSFLDFTAFRQRRSVQMGETVKIDPGEGLVFQCIYRASTAARIIPIIDGVEAGNKVKYETLGDGKETKATFGFIGDRTRHWVRVDVVDDAGGLLLLGNPIYVLSEGN